MQRVEQLMAAQFKAVERQHWAGIGSVWHETFEALLDFRTSKAQCRGGSCTCLHLQDCLQRLLERAAEVQPQLDTLVDLKMHVCLPTYCSYIPDCPHAAATRLAVADAYYKLIALPQYKCRAQQAADAAAAPPAAVAAAAHSPPTGLCNALANPIGHFLTEAKVLRHPPAQFQMLQSQWTKVLRRLQKAEEALPPNNQPLSPASAATLSNWICEGPKGKDAGIDNKLNALLPTSHTMILWAAAVCRVVKVNVFANDLAVDVVQPAAGLAAALLDVTSTMGRLSAAGISFNTQPSPAAVAVALDLAAQVVAGLRPFLYKRLRFEQQEQQQQQPQPPPLPLPLPPLYLSPLQQQQEDIFKQDFLASKDAAGRLLREQFEDIITVHANKALNEPQQSWSLGVPLIIYHGSHWLQQWEQQQLQQQQQGVQPLAPGHPGVVRAGGASSSSSSSSSSSRSRPAWQVAEGMLLLAAATLQETSQQHNLQQLQQQLALCRQYQQHFQQAAAKLGLSSELMEAVAAWFYEAEQCSSSSEGAAAGSSAAADCLAVVCTASLLLWLVDPLIRRAAQRSKHFSAAEQRLVAEFYLQVPGLLAATAAAAVMQTQSADAAAAGPVLSQLPMVAHALQLYKVNWLPLTHLLFMQRAVAMQAAAQQGASMMTGPASQQQQQQCSVQTAQVCAAAARTLLGSASILLQQLLRMATAAADVQQQQLRAAILYCADALGGELNAFWLDLRRNQDDDSFVDDSLLPYNSQNATALARAVQTVEAAVRHLAAAVPSAARTNSAGSSSAGSSSGKISAGSSSSSSSRLVPSSIIQVERTAVSIYCILIRYASNIGNIGNSRSLSCPQQQLLQASLSLLLTTSKLWEAGLQPPVPLKSVQSVASEAMLNARVFGGPQLADDGPHDSPVSVAAAVAAALAAAGGVQVCHLASRYLSCVEHQLRQLGASGDAVGAAKWLASAADQSFTSSATAAAAGGASSRLEALETLLKATEALMPQGAGWFNGGGKTSCERLRVLCNQAKQVLDAVQAGTGNKSGSKAQQRARQKLERVQLDGLLASLDDWADALQDFGSALAVSLPSRFGCNWPGCVRLSGVSEGYGLVRGQACVCGGCRQARYCSMACQAAHWPAHKAFCQQHHQRQQQQEQQQVEESAASAAATDAAATNMCRQS